MQRADTLWSEIDPLMDQKIASAYDQATAQLQELRDAYAQAGDVRGFQQKLDGFRRRYSNRPAMLRRIETL
jgi:tryptophan synthase beta subunit